jgi:tetratricopeptide (TPR) repeat protein
MLAHSQRNQGRSADDWMPVAEQAFQLAAGLPARERYFIEGSYHQMKEEWPRAIAAYEALIDEQPNDFWGQNNLALAYRLSGRFREDFQLSKRLALQRPNDASTLVNYAARLVINGEGVSDAMKLAARASTLERPPGTAASIEAAWLELLPVFAAWSDGRVTEAAALMDRVSGIVPATEWHTFARGQMNLTLGRVKAAERAFQLLPDPAEREILLGYTALARGDTAGARARLARAVPAWAEQLRTKGPVRLITPTWVLLRAGLLEECRQAIGPWIGKGADWARRGTGCSRWRRRSGAARAAGLRHARAPW